MRFWNSLIGEAKGTVLTQISLYHYGSKDIINLVKDKIVTREEVIASGVIESMFTHELSDYIYPRDLHHEEVTKTLDRRAEDKKRLESGENP